MSMTLDYEYLREDVVYTDCVCCTGGFCRWNRRSGLYSHIHLTDGSTLTTRYLQQFRTALQGLNLRYYTCAVVKTRVLRFVWVGLLS